MAFQSVPVVLKDGAQNMELFECTGEQQYWKCIGHSVPSKSIISVLGQYTPTSTPHHCIGDLFKFWSRTQCIFSHGRMMLVEMFTMCYDKDLHGHIDAFLHQAAMVHASHGL